jgi:predicted nucleotide-binding protein (sugar kinase/HSP70/actin superfamily)
MEGADACFGADRRSIALQPEAQGVGIIGEFWAMTTEGDGNYRTAAVPPEQEGAEVDMQFVTNWILLHGVGGTSYDTQASA